ncbi:hypothetical protein GYB29_01280 [bacterium]|nr:hypothetical protein [bacterium]
MSQNSLNFPFPKLKALVLEELLNQQQGDHISLCGGVVELAISKNLFQGKLGVSAKFQYLDQLDRNDRRNLEEAVREIMWQLIVQGLIVIGLNTTNPNWPNYKITQKGLDYISNGDVQPYDPNGFLNDFKSKNPSCSDKVYSYLEEAVLGYNNGLMKSCAVMLGAASESLILELNQAILDGFASSADKQSFESRYRYSISSKFHAIESLLQHNISNRNITGDLKEKINSYFSSIFHLFRRTRNEAGHPEILRNIAEDELFLNLRIFGTYTSCVEELKSFARSGALSL